jgi:hypothetical protein
MPDVFFTWQSVAALLQDIVAKEYIDRPEYVFWCIKFADALTECNPGFDSAARAQFLAMCGIKPGEV